MKYDVKAFELLSNEEIADGIFDMRVKNDELAPLAKCGQFAHVYVPSKTLRRPISVCATAKTAYSALFTRLRARAQRLCQK